jgi:hypothetical protein
MTEVVEVPRSIIEETIKKIDEVLKRLPKE